MRLSLYQRAPEGMQTRWASFENPSAGKGAAATTNKGAKGHAFDWLAAGETKTLLDIRDQSGLITRIWMTTDDRTPEMLQALRLKMFWDGEETPAVSAPLGDFFGATKGRMATFENEFFSSPEGRSFHCNIPMPFRTAARITLTNGSDRPLRYLFYDINLLTGVEHDAGALYFHARHRQETTNALGEPFDILPRIEGAGRFLGCNVGVQANSIYETTWWGEGEVKAWMDGDTINPTLCGTGAEDYIGTAWGQGAFINRTQGCVLANGAARQWAFYRFHADDPIYFQHDFRAAIDAMGGAPLKDVLRLREAGVPLVPISLAWNGGPSEGDEGGEPEFLAPNRTPFLRLLDVSDAETYLNDAALADKWCNFYRQDDWTATGLFLFA